MLFRSPASAQEHDIMTRVGLVYAKINAMTRVGLVYTKINAMTRVGLVYAKNNANEIQAMTALQVRTRINYDPIVPATKSSKFIYIEERYIYMLLTKSKAKHFLVNSQL